MHETERRGGDRHTEQRSRIRDVEDRPDFSVEELERERVAASQEAHHRIVEIKHQIAREEPAPSVLDVPVQTQEPQELNVFQKAYASLKQSKLAKMLMVAAGLHVPMTPQGRTMIDRVVHGVESVNPNWFKEGMVIHPQSDEKKAEVRAQIRERELRVDKKAVAEYEKKTAEQLAHGEHISFKRMYFDLERLHGVPAEEVAEAERIADSLIEKYVNEIGGSLDQQKIKRIVEERFGSEKAYDWSQALVSTYFRTGKRNCDSIDRALQIVLEGVIERLPESERSRYELGETAQKQHVIATLTVRHGGAPTTYLLEPGLRTLQGESPEPGTVRVNADFLKKSTVASEIVAVAAVAGKSGEVAPSPNIDVVTNQAIPRGYITTGELKGSSFNYEQAEKEGLEPEKYVDTAVAPMQVEILDERNTSEQANALFDQRMTDAGTHVFPTKIETSELRNPSAEDVRKLGLRMQEEGVPYIRVEGFRITSLDGWSQDSVHELLRAPIDSLEINAATVQPVTLERVLDSTISSKDVLAHDVVLAGTELETRHGISFQHFGIEDFYKILSKFDKKDRTIIVKYPTLDLWEWEAIKGLEAQIIDLSYVKRFHIGVIGDNKNGDISVDVTKIYADDEQNADVGKVLLGLQVSGKRICIDGTFFMNQVLRDDKVFDYRNIVPSFEDIERGQLAWFRSELLKKHHPRIKGLIERIDYEIGRQNTIEERSKH